MKMGSLTEDLLTIVLAKLPLKSIATSKIVCKQWKSIAESKFFYQLFQSHHQNSHSLWSLMCHVSQKETIAHYGCNSWGLTGSLNSYISSFITSLFHTERLYGHPKESVRVVAYSDIGLILICFANQDASNKTYYVANPISREYVKIPPLIPCFNGVTTYVREGQAGLVTQVENDVVISYKIVLENYIRGKGSEYEICFHIYSSETGLWSFKNMISSFCITTRQPISLNGNLYWIGYNDTPQEFVLVYHNFYATGTESDRCKVIHFPGVENDMKFRRVCTNSQGSIMYMKTVSKDKDDGSLEYSLSVWRLKSEEWQLVSEISPDLMDPSLYNIELTINPFDARTIYFWSKEQDRLASINLDKCKIGFHDNFECNSDGCNQRFSEAWFSWSCIFGSRFCMVVLPRWLYRIPCSPS